MGIMSVRDGYARLLFVGDYPLTAGLYNQLPEHEYDQVTHLGQVKPGGDIIGIHKDTGELCRVRDWVDDDDDAWRKKNETANALAMVSDEASKADIRKAYAVLEAEFQAIRDDITRKINESESLPHILLVEGERR